MNINGPKERSLIIRLLSHAEEGTSEDQLVILKREREKQKNAISRLTELYIYDPDAITKEEYSEKKRDLSYLAIINMIFRIDMLGHKKSRRLFYKRQISGAGAAAIVQGRFCGSDCK